ncbi:MAG: hypothetical protein WA705_19375 [Candidatus Ozemobacteraceae bacterium]
MVFVTSDGEREFEPVFELDSEKKGEASVDAVAKFAGSEKRTNEMLQKKKNQAEFNEMMSTLDASIFRRLFRHMSLLYSDSSGVSKAMKALSRKKFDYDVMAPAQPASCFMRQPLINHF